MKLAHASLTVTLLCATATATFADPVTVKPCPPVATAFSIRPDGKVFELSNSETTFTIDWTDRSGADIGVGAITLKTTRFRNTDVFRSEVVDAPKTLSSGGQNVEVCDFTQTTQRTGHTGEINVLSVEAITFDPSTGDFETSDIFEALATFVGFGVEVSIPDLYADTNRDGSLGPGDLLYSIVDLRQYLATIPFPIPSFGDHFNIVNGFAAGLPGMEFSSTPFSIDPHTGDFLGTPITIDAVELSSHQITATVPEPTAGLLFATGLLGVLCKLRILKS